MAATSGIYEARSGAGVPAAVESSEQERNQNSASEPYSLLALALGALSDGVEGPSACVLTYAPRMDGGSMSPAAGVGAGRGWGVVS